MSIDNAILEIQRSQQEMAKDMGTLIGKVDALDKKVDEHMDREEEALGKIEKRTASLEQTRSRVKGFLYALPFVGSGGAVSIKWESLKHWIGLGS